LREEEGAGVGCAVGRRGCAGDVGDGGDRTLGLAVSDGLAILDVGSGEVLDITLALFEDTILGVVGNIVVAANSVVDVLAVVPVVGVGRVASLEAEAVATEEQVPLDDLSGVAVESIGEEETTHRVTTEISTVGVHLSSPVTLENVDLGLVDEADSLDVGLGLDPLNTGQGVGGNETRAVSGLGAPSDHDTLDVTDFLAVVRGTPDTEVIDTVKVGSLAVGGLGEGGFVANVETVLDTTDEVGVGVNLVGKVWPGELLGGVGRSGEGGLGRGRARGLSDCNSSAGGEEGQTSGKSD
jgi:hypothetical protein